MFRAIQTLGLKAFLSQEAPFAVAALFVAEVFYKFHSFVLECAAFLATWYALSCVAHLALQLLRRDEVRE